VQKLLYTTAEAKAVIGCGTTRLYQLLANGKLRARRLGHSTMIEADSLLELVESLPRVTTPTMRCQTSGDTEPKPAV
jgi:excisionase family DNA binding protein